MKRLMTLLLLVIGLASSLSSMPTAAAATGERCFRETGHCISGAIRTYWERNGGLKVFGYPIAPLQTETNNDGWTGPTQWFERDRLEDHANESYGVLAGRLGVRMLELQGRPWESFGRVARANPGCRYFPITGHQLCGAFLSYWEHNGGLERFGYPITEAFHEEQISWGGTAQYFERRRMELHPEFAGTEYEVLLGLLGSDTRDPYRCQSAIRGLEKTAQAFPELFACGAPFPQVNVGIVTQPFERGQMVYVPGSTPGNPGFIWVVFYDNSRRSLVWNNYPNSWREGEPERGNEQPPTGLLEPIRGFGKLWRSNPEIRNTLGWAVSPEFPDIGHLQYFRGGAWMLYRSAPDRVFILRNDQTAEDMSRLK